MNKPARIYLRRNGSFGSACDGTDDTGHHITHDLTAGTFTVYSVHLPDEVIAHNVWQRQAEIAIANDWRADHIDASHLAETRYMRNVWRCRRFNPRHWTDGMTIAIPKPLPALDRPDFDAPWPTKAEIDRYTFRLESCGYHNAANGTTCEWWNIICDGKIIDMEWYER